MHHIHTTDGLVLGSKPYGEAGKIVTIFTRNFGLVNALAEGIRLEKSKLRYNIQNLSLVNFSLVKGKESWRVIGALELKIKAEPEKEKIKMRILSSLALLLKRFLQGEGVHEEIFNDIESCLNFLDESSLLDYDQSQTTESLLVIKILGHLGYIDHSILNINLRTQSFSLDFINNLKSRKMEMNKYINRALEESQL